jgi:structural maintenance of chromosome 2
VYKQGQAGVTKATVTIVFNNSDPATSPVGYETHKQITVTRQVVIGGKNKYMINGHTVQQSAVQNLFHSVQLNVNNPHFLIMQGRITKVLNMKPLETLSMIEEAAGTRMFETKKQAAIKTIEKKQLKVEEISKCMAEEITPTLEGLREERAHYLTWQANSLELERLERFCVASEYRSAEVKVNAAEADKQALVQQLDELTATEKKAQAEADDCAKKAAKIAEMRDAEANGDFAQLKNTEIDLSKDLVKANTLLSNHKESLTTEQDNFKSLSKQNDGAASSLSAKTAELQRCNEELAVKEKEAAAAEAAALAARERYQNACAGVADETSAALLSLPEQVGSWEKRGREAESQLEQGKLRAKHAAAQLKELQKNSSKQTAAHAQGVKDVESLRAKVASLEEQMRSLGSKTAGEGDLSAHASKLKRSCTDLTDHVTALRAQVEARLKLEFRDPEKGFDRSRVKGMVARLVTVNDSKAAGALETVAGGKLISVVVDTEATANLLIEKGQLKKRLTFLPLNKLKSDVVPADKCAAAARIAAQAGGSAKLALELVGFDEEVRTAMQFAFGDTFVCDSAKTGKLVAFDKNVRSKTVTLDGDVYNPSGTLTGGSSSNLGTLLSMIGDLNSSEAALAAQRHELKAVEAAIKAGAADSAAVERVQSELETKRYALQMAEEKLSSTSYSLAQQEIVALERQIADCDQEAVALKAASERAKEELKKLKTAEAGIKKQREAAMKDIEAAMKTAQKNASTVKAELAVVKNRRDALAAEVAAIQRDSASTKEQLKATEAAIERMTKELDALTSQVRHLLSLSLSPPHSSPHSPSFFSPTVAVGEMPRQVRNCQGRRGQQAGRAQRVLQGNQGPGEAGRGSPHTEAEREHRGPHPHAQAQVVGEGL